MQVSFTNEVEAHSESFGSRTNTSQRGLCRFLHHVAEFSGERHAATTLDQRSFNLEHFATDFSPRQTSRQSDFAFGTDTLLTKLDRTQHLADALSVNYNDIFRGFVCLFGDKLTRQLAAARADLAFEIANARFASVVTNNFQNASVGKIKLFRLQPVAFSLFPH